MGTKERKEREKEQRRDHILKAGEKLFLEKGIDATTMDEIAGKCELSKGTLYLYFRSKEEVFLSITGSALSALCGMFREAAARETDPGSKLRALGETILGYYEKYPDYYKLMVKLYDHQMFIKEDLRDITGSIVGQIADMCALVSGIIEEGKESGLFKKNTNSAEVAISLWSVSTMFIGIIDHLNTHDHSGVEMNSLPFNRLDMKELLMLNGKRIIYSILNDPPPDFDKM